MTTTDAELDAFMNEPIQRQCEVTVAHRIGYWSPADVDDITSDMIAEADAYLEAHIQWRIAQALGNA